jgi:hypothetical protein
MRLSLPKNRDQPPARGMKMLRARSLPTTRPFHIASAFYALFVLGLIMTSTTLLMLVKTPNEFVLKAVIGSLGFTIVCWMIAFFKRRKALCPLCKGTPLINSGARPHMNASSLPILNHGVTATLSVIVTQRFCCMYCGSYFDLLKPSAHLRRNNPGNSTE